MKGGASRMIASKVRLISDLHLLPPDDDAADCASEEDLLDFLEETDSLGFGLIILGDLIEGWHGVSYKKIIAAYPNFFRRLTFMGYHVRIMIGNHDRLPWGKSITKLLKRQFGLECFDTFVTDLDGTRILSIHGHQFDSPNKRGRKFGWLVTRITGWMERHLWKDLDLAYSRLKRNNPVFQSGVDYAQECSDLAKKRVSAVVNFGHTHTPSIKEVDGIKVLNAGSWVHGHRDYLQYVDGKWTLESFGQGV